MPGGGGEVQRRAAVGVRRGQVGGPVGQQRARQRAARGRGEVRGGAAAAVRRGDQLGGVGCELQEVPARIRRALLGWYTERGLQPMDTG